MLDIEYQYVTILKGRGEIGREFLSAPFNSARQSQVVLLPSLRALCDLCVKSNTLPISTRSMAILQPTAKSHRLIFLTDPHHLTPMESYSCKKQGRGPQTHAICFRSFVVKLYRYLSL